MHKRKGSNNSGAPGRDKIKKYSLDSDEEDSDTGDNVLDENDIEGEEEGVDHNVGEERFTAFNMQEEMQEGHFDTDGHFIWKNEKEVKDNWLDNIDWQKIKSDKKPSEQKGLGEADSDESDEENPVQELDLYKEILTYLQPNETISKALQRLGNKKKLSSIERIQLRKAGKLDTNQSVIELTELANRILSQSGNMDIYQETYEQIKSKIASSESKTRKTDESLDMYADDFDQKEKQQLESTTSQSGSSVSTEISWEIKWKQNEEKIDGPFSTEKMRTMACEGKFKDGAWVRKCGENTNFYTANRIDFDLYM